VLWRLEASGHQCCTHTTPKRQGGQADSRERSTTNGVRQWTKSLPPESGGKHLELSKGVHLRLARLGSIAAILSPLPLSAQPLTCSSAQLSCQICRTTCCGVLFDLMQVLRTLVDRFEWCCTSRRLLTLPTTARGTSALAGLRQSPKIAHVLVRRTA
jgi:hypothetical protein